MTPRQAKVYMVAQPHVMALFRGEGCIANLPFDAEILSCQPGPDRSLAVMVYSSTFPHVPARELLPVVNAILGRRR